jgi:hypothetical protein
MFLEKSIAKKFPILDTNGEKVRGLGKRKECTLAISLEETNTVFVKIKCDYP